MLCLLQLGCGSIKKGFGFHIPGAKGQELQPHSSKVLSCNQHPLPALAYPKNALDDVLTSPVSSGLAASLPCAENILVGSLSHRLPSLSLFKIFAVGICYVQIQALGWGNHSF